MHPLSNIKGDLEGGHKLASNRVYPLVSSPWDGRAMGGSIWGMLPVAIFLVLFFHEEEKWSEARSRADMGRILGRKSHLSIANLVRSLLAMTMEI